MQARQALINRLKFKFLVTYHSYGQLLLYAYGWQIPTPSLDDPLFLAYTGTDASPAVQGFDPGVGADLYTTNGTTDDYSYLKTGALSWTPSSRKGATAADSSSRTTRPSSKPSSSGTCRSPSTWRSRRPPRPIPCRISAPRSPFYLDTTGPIPRDENPLSDFTFRVSYGDPQPVHALAKRSLGAVTLRHQVNGGPAMARRRRSGTAASDGRAATSTTTSSRARDRHPTRRFRKGRVRGCGQPRSKSDSFTYTAKVESSNACSCWRPRTTPASRPCTSNRDRRTCRTTSTRWPPTASGPTSTTSTRTAAGHQRPRRTHPLRRRHLVHGRRRDHARARHGPGNRVPARPR